MPYCLKCHTEYREGVTKCADRGGKLMSDDVAALAKDFRQRVSQSSRLTGGDSIEVTCLKCGKRAHVHPLMISMPCPDCGGDSWLADKPSSPDRMSPSVPS